MALNVPSSTEPIATAGGSARTTWYRFFADVARLLNGTGVQHGSAVIADDQAATILTIAPNSVGMLEVGHSSSASVSYFGVDTFGTYAITTKVLGTDAANGGLGSASAGSGVDTEHTWYVSSGGIVSVSNRTGVENTFWAKFSRGNL